MRGAWRHTFTKHGKKQKLPSEMVQASASDSARTFMKTQSKGPVPIVFDERLGFGDAPKHVD